MTILTSVLDDPKAYGRVVRDRDGSVLARRRAEGRRRGHRRHPRDQLRHLRLRRAGAARGAGAGHHRQRAGREVPDRRGGDRPGRRTPGQRAPAGRRVADRGRQRPGPAGRGRRRAEPPGRRRSWMRAGVTVVDPASTWVDVQVQLARDVRLLPGTQLHGETTVATGATIGPDTHADRRAGGRGRHAWSARTAASAVIGDGAIVGPVRLPAPGHGAGRPRQDRHLRGDQERADRHGLQGAAPVLRRGRHDRRALEHRCRLGVRELRRGDQVPHHGRRPLPHRFGQHVRRAGQRGRRRVHAAPAP